MTKRIGIYIHIPFCISKCAYCDFYSVADGERLMSCYQQAFIGQLAESAPVLDGYYVDTVYFGGGTPSYYGAKRIAGLFNTLKDHYKVLLDAEVTVEVNPDSVSGKDLRLLRKEGVNRLSIGVQTADDGLAKSLGRRHTFRQAERTVERARKAGFENISLDLIYGLPGQSKADWADTLNRVITLRPEHVSCYGLRIEENTPLHVFRDSPLIPGEDDQADMYLFTVEALRDVGYRQYEVSNFSLPGRESKHNLKYWNREEYVGFGPSAHSYVGDLRYSYIKGVEEYLEALEGKRDILASSDDIPKSEQAVEYLMLGLRTTRGITGEEYYGVYQSGFGPIEALLLDYEKQGWAHRINGRWSLTPTGFLLSNQLISDILDAHTEQRFTVGMPWKKNEYAAYMAQTELK
ncbi:MAG: radical SAM family heme chaperone HemW [Oscillospiraceae bacterium]|nr:radical SAM family heme chaperone HemW [Oscillospiraceae bacterium]